MALFEPIGYLKCERSYHEEQPRQGNLSASQGYIELILGHNYEQGLKDLDGFSHIWLIYEFHQNKTWRPLANPPRTDGKGRKGVFATRSPYRPNQIGLSCVKLISIEKNKIFIADSDLLNNTPILDIKPYIPYADSHPDARGGFTDELSKGAQVKVDFPEELLLKLPEEIRKSAVDVLGQDPRAGYDRGKQRDFRLAYHGYDIVFLGKDGEITVTDVLKI